MKQPALSLHQPRASLCVTRQPSERKPDRKMSDAEFDHLSGTPMPMVKTMETRSWPCPPKLIGERILIHATKRLPADGKVGDCNVYHLWSDRSVCYLESPGIAGQIMPLGAIVGSATIEACYPIVGEHDDIPSVPYVERTDQNRLQLISGFDVAAWSDISDQLPYGDYSTDGKPRYAWLLTDAAPTTERCPWCLGQVYRDEDGEHGCRVKAGETPISGGTWSAWVTCPVCEGAGHCDPIPAKGAQRIWNWGPA